MATGELEVLGRLDSTVKVNGFRVDTGEVQRAMCHAGAAEPSAADAGGPPAERVVTDAFVVVVGEFGKKALVGFVLSAAEPEQAIAAAERGLAHNVPAYMHPLRIHVLKSAPKSPSLFRFLPDF